MYDSIQNNLVTHRNELEYRSAEMANKMEEIIPFITAHGGENVLEKALDVYRFLSESSQGQHVIKGINDLKFP